MRSHFAEIHTERDDFLLEPFIVRFEGTGDFLKTDIGVDFVCFVLAQTFFEGLDIVCPPSAMSTLGKTVLTLTFLVSAEYGSKLTLSGSSTLTFLPGFARSGNTHSLLGFAKTLPELDDVSLFPPDDAVGVGGSGAGVLRGVVDDADDGRRTRTGGGAAGRALSPGAGRGAMADVEGRGCMMGRV